MWVSGVLSLESALVISMSLAKSLKSVHWTCLVHWVETSPSWLPAMQIIQIKVTVGFLWDKDFCLLVCVERQIDREAGWQRKHPSTVLFSRCVQQRKLDKAKTMSQEFNPGPRDGWQEPNFLSYFLPLPQICIRLEPGARARTQIHVLWYRVQESEWPP